MKPQAGKERRRIVVGISGGINSAVAAGLLKSQGYDVRGVHLQVFAPEQAPEQRFGARCCQTKSVAAAREACRKLDVPLHVLNVQDAFEEAVVDGYVHDLLQARLPDPCIACHVRIRLGSLLRYADGLGCEQVATGHHAQVVSDAAGTGGDTRARLQCAANRAKDQSYFLFGLGQRDLARLVFPLGGFQDLMVERLAREFGLPEAAPANPQKICLSEGDAHLAFFEARVPIALRPGGNIRMTDGSVLGEHRGLHAYRVGQNKVKLAPHIKEQEKYVVTAFDPVGRAMIVGSEKDLYHVDARASRATWIRPVDQLHGMRATARLSPSQAEAWPCRVTYFENDQLRIEFDQPCKGLVVGNAIVFYDGDEVLGGAYIESVGTLPKGE
jgi:tRNA-specific 2-thiouridylase